MADNESAESPGELLICRHGETDWSRTGRHTGSTDVPLTADGETEARALAPLLAARADRIRLVLVSPRQRARETARLAGITGATVTADLSEWDYGAYEGLTTDEIRRDRPEWTIWTGNPPGGETADDVSARADRLLHGIRDSLATGDVLVIGHGHFGRVLAARYLGLPACAGALLRLDPATMCVLGTEHESPTIVRWNLPGGQTR
jgi:probable phosphoglycerate mutase